MTTSVANVLPSDRTVILPPPASLMRNAASTAFSSKPLSTEATPRLSAIRILSASMRKAEAGVSGSGTCFTQTIMLATAPSFVPPSHRALGI